MALGATICKAELNVIDIDRNYYQQHSLILAQHPSETDERLMIRLLVFALHASESLCFTKGLSSEEEPELWQKSLADEIELWIELGLPSEKRLKKASGRAQQVIVYTYGSGSAEQWWKQLQRPLDRYNNIKVFHIGAETSQSLMTLAQRKMDVQISIQDGEITWDSGEQIISITLEQLR